MPDESAETGVPEWVKEARERGYSVRVGTDPRPLPYRPELFDDEWAEPREGFRERLISFVQTLSNRVAAFKRRLVHR